jgi:serine/threonine protein kinase
MLLLIRCRNTRTNQNVIVKSAPGILLKNEREMLQRFRKVPSLRHLVDQVQDPSLLVLEYLDSNLLIESAAKKLESKEVKQVAKAVLQALAALHEEGIVHTGT